MIVEEFDPNCKRCKQAIQWGPWYELDGKPGQWNRTGRCGCWDFVHLAGRFVTQAPATFKYQVDWSE